jgi:hypothetical protein
MTKSSDADLLVSYRRSGGRPPPDDERLDIRPDGSFEARRTVGLAMAGGFAGALEAATLRTLTDTVAAVAGEADLVIPTRREGATEVIEAGGHQATLGSGERPAGAWGDLVGQLRSLIVKPVIASPRAAVELQATVTEAALVHVGSEPIDVDFSLIEIHVVELDRERIPGQRWFATTRTGPDPDVRPPARWATATAGWRQALPFAHGLELAPGASLQVLVTVPIREGGTLRVAKLGVYVEG